MVRAEPRLFGLPLPAVALAAALVVFLMAGWTLRTWVPLSAFRLPDNDDMMRLAEVRDWLGGQGLNDLTQHRLGWSGGASMHWSRLADAGPAAIILLLTPIMGRHGAELAMLIGYPAILFFAAIVLAARIVRRIDPRAVTIAAVAAGLSFPANTLFIPGRIDHHGIQIVLSLVFLERVIAPPRWFHAAAAGTAAALSLAIGLETLPLVLIGMAALFWRFVITDPVAGARIDSALGSFGAALGGTTLVLLAMLHPNVWPRAWCDGFTPASTGATLIAAGYFILLGMTGPRLGGWRLRLGTGALLGAAALPLVYQRASVCLNGPYGAIDPMLQELWMSRVGEALGMFGQDSAGVAVAYCAAGFVAAGATAWLLRTGRWRSTPWQMLAIVVTLGALLTIVQIRATYIVSIIAAVPLAVLIREVRAQSHTLVGRLGIWVLCCGVTYNVLGAYVDSGTAMPVIAQRVAIASCTGPDQLEALRRLPAGRVIAPLDSGAYLIGGTGHSVLAAPYHRNNEGNLAAYRFFLGPIAAAKGIARAWRADYVVMCGTSFIELGPMTDRPGTVIAALRAGHPPAWLGAPIARSGGLRVYAVKARLPQGAPPL